MVWLGPSQKRRRLRFSFQFNDVKDRDRLRRPHCLAPVVGGGGYLGGRPVPVNQTFQSFFRTVPEDQNHSKAVNTQTSSPPTNFKKSKNFPSSSRRRSVRGGGYLEGRPILVNRTFQSFASSPG